MIEFSHTPQARWLVISGILLAAMLGISYWLARGNCRAWLRLALTGLRCTIIAAVVACLLNPQWAEAIKRQQPGAIRRSAGQFAEHGDQKRRADAPGGCQALAGG